MSNDFLLVSDDGPGFYTLEGEGEHIGRPSVFFRLAGCNLTCKSFASPDSPHGCDSFISWSIKNKTSFKDIFKFYKDNLLIDNLKNGAIWKLTGGEPLQQQKKLLPFVKEFIKKYEFQPRIDFETNATITPDRGWVEHEVGATFTTSPKLTTNGDPESKTYKPDVLRWHVEQNSGFKFVITSDRDIEEIWKKYVDDKEDIHVPLNRIWFMPCCGSRQELIDKSPAVAEFAKAMGVNFSPRLQLLIWNKALRV
jgi:6-pyruvoyltetrahydropterin 2'-reductase